MDKAGAVGTCFIITPIGTEDSPTRATVDALVDDVITPVLVKNQLRPEVSHRITEGGSITGQIIQRLLEAELVVANLTGLNPNVMYELAVRHAVRRPIIIIADSEVTPVLPFDVKDERTIFYQDTVRGGKLLREALERMVPAAIQDEVPDTPIHRADAAFLMKRAAISEPQEYILERLDDIDARLSTAFPHATASRVLELVFRGPPEVAEVVHQIVQRFVPQASMRRYGHDETYYFDVPAAVAADALTLIKAYPDVAANNAMIWLREPRY